MEGGGVQYPQVELLLVILRFTKSVMADKWNKPRTSGHSILILCLGSTGEETLHSMSQKPEFPSSMLLGVGFGFAFGGGGEGLLWIRQGG